MCIVAIAGLLMADLAQIVALGLMFVMFVSPIAFKADMVPPALSVALYAESRSSTWWRPIGRACCRRAGAGSATVLAAYALMCLAVFFAGACLFQRLKRVIAEYE